MTDVLRPVSGETVAVAAALESWLHDGGEPLVVRTSGSSGEPKNVLLSRDAVLASVAATESRLGGRGSWLLALPVTGVAGLMILARSIVAGRAVTHLDRHPSISAAIEAMPSGRRYASLVPTQFHRLVMNHETEALSALDALLMGGAAMPADLRRAVDASGVSIVRTYGMSETCGGCVYDGIPLDGVQMRLADEGRIELAGPTLFDGYSDSAATHRVLRDGWFSTDDLGEIVDGRLTVLGRRDDVVISGGVNIALPAVTEALRGLNGVGDAVAIAIPDPEWGSSVVACVVPADAVCLDGLRLDELRDGVEEAGLPRTWAPRDVRLLDALPLLPGGKIDRKALGHRAE